MRLKELFAVGSVLFLALLYLYFFTPPFTSQHPAFSLSWDHHHYMYMAEHPLFQFYISPYCWRFLNPLLAKLMPFSLETNFRVLSFIALLGASIFLYLLLRTIGFTRILSLFGALLFISLGWATSYNLYNFWLTDSLAFFFITAGLWAIYKKNDLLFLFILTIGVTAKETVFFLAPLYFTIKTGRTFEWHLLLRTVLLAVPAATVLLLLRLAVPSLNGDAEYVLSLPPDQREMHIYTLEYMIKNIALLRLNDFGLKDLITFSTGTFGISLLLLPFLFLRSNYKSFLRFLPLYSLSLMSIAFAYNTERLIVAAFPVFIIMSTESARQLIKRFPAPDILLLILPVILIILHGTKNAFVLSYLLESLVFFGFLSLIIFTSESENKLILTLKRWSDETR
ncbi:MAG: hypothetical protein L6Q47_11930 [Ignavibacteriaceae bacterium]|nr:hypothetical protein [Ignavibacteriaceae bacterium]